MKGKTGSYTKLTVLILVILSYVHATGQITIDQNKYYQIVLVQNGEALTNPGHPPDFKRRIAMASEAKLITQKREQQDKKQHWRFIKVNESGTLFMITNRHFNNYIDIPFGRKDQRETLIGYRNKGGVNQQFYLVKLENNKYLISSALSGYTLSVVRNNERHCVYREEHPTIGGSVNSGPFPNCTKDADALYVKQMPLTGNPNQQWYIIPVTE